ncbi:copper amine oxidase [Paraflavitalea sp. CAU 1676]|uniref:copper amine oxidase n=1 Tax=Paraflavitalea sp. CAU 1676 TaxID=3032598 RepID=UPI0023DAA4E1|nr:copper amine oxidase [Paraflavitalea sp. CAU 1676]MDF2189626.1 copper amine oxidase [Paraflavitalea sp. CAU 1676]
MIKKSLKKAGCLSLLFAGSLATTLPSLAQEIGPELSKRVLAAPQGGLIELPGVLTEKFQQVGYRKVVLPGPQYLISDDPEYIRVPEAIALREAVDPGTVRLYVYNVNGVKEPAKIETRIAAVIKNTGKTDMRLRMLKYSSQKPTTNYFLAGKQGLADFFAATPQTSVRIVKPGKSITIDPAHEKFVVKYDELVHGFYEFVIDQPGEISILQTDTKTPVTTAAERIKNILPSKGNNAGRGVFGVSNYRVEVQDTLDTKDGIKQIIVADGNKDPWVLGTEGTSGRTATLAGNYGVMYQVEMKWKSTDGRGLALVTWNSRADNGQWCGGMANTMIVSKGKFKEGIIQLPADKLVTRKSPEAILVQVFPPAANGAEQTIKFTYSPPGASCLPTPLVFIPVDMK